MKNEDQLYRGLKCYLCKYWFSKMYLFKQHNRKEHRNFGEFIDLPPVPVQGTNPENIMLFAQFHADRDLPLLMRIFETKTQCTMRVANRYDFEELKQQQNFRKDGLKISIVYDVFPALSGGEITGFTVLPWVKSKRDQKDETIQPSSTNTPHQLEKEVLPAQPACFPRHTENDVLDEGNMFLQNIPNPFCDLLEHLVSQW